jgi:hypothetical protein
MLLGFAPLLSTSKSDGFHHGLLRYICTDILYLFCYIIHSELRHHLILVMLLNPKKLRLYSIGVDISLAVKGERVCKGESERRTHPSVC